MRRVPVFGCRRPVRAQSRRQRVVLPIGSRLDLIDIAHGVQTARFTIGRELKTPNYTQWQVGRVIADRRDWKRAIANAIEMHLTTVEGEAITILDRQFLENRDKSRRAPKIKARVVITRIVPSKRNFLQDDDNLLFAAKHLVDVLKKLALIYEDRRTWCDRPLPAQRVSDAGIYQTVIEVTPWLRPQLPGRNHAPR